MKFSWRKIAPGFKRYTLSEREAAFICQVLNLYCEASDKRKQGMVDKITKILNGPGD